MKSLTDTCFAEAKKQLLSNTTEFGFLAASPKDPESKAKDYTSLFSRDVGVCVWGAIVSEEDALINAARQSLLSLSQAQSAKGQFPFYYIPESKKIEWWSPGSPDSTLWWCIASLEYYQAVKDTKLYQSLLPHVEKAFTWLTYQDTNNDLLIEQGEASDWADEMPRMGTVLYTNALWYWFLSLRVKVEKRTDLKELQKKVHEGINTLLWVHKRGDNNISYIPDNDYTKTNTFAKSYIEWSNSRTVYLPYYLGCVSHKSFEMRCDVYGNILACLTGLANEEQQELITEFIIRSGCNLPYPVKALYPPIYPGEPDWREYMAKGRQDYPWQYHNGGIWPYIGGFWVTLLQKIGHAHAPEALEQLAKANQINNWEFNEYLHGQLGTPMGIPHQSWNMGTYIRAYRSKGSEL